MKILLINIPAGERTPSYFPLGLGYIAKILLNEGHDVKVLDIFAKGYNQKKVIEIIHSLEYDFVGISAMSPEYNYVKWLSKELKKYHKGKIILGGALPTFSSEIILKNTEVDICIIGEGEETIKDIIKNKNNLKEVKGIYFREKNKIVKNHEREYIKDLDRIPLPAWDLFPIEIYLKTPSSPEGYCVNSMNIITARGCPYNCNFCSKTFKGTRLRSIDNIINEIKELIKRYNVKVINFADELVMVNKQRMYELCKKIKPLNLKWVCQGRVNVVDYDILKTMKKAGCCEVGYGIESGSLKILKNMNKCATPEMAANAIIAAKKTGVRPILQTMFGYPGEDKQTIKETIDFFKKVHAHPDGVSITTPLPGTVLYEEVRKKGLIKDEEKYLEDLKGTGQFTLNLTEMSDEELVKMKKFAEKTMHQNYYRYRRSHPLVLIKDYNQKAIRFIKYVRLNGLKKSISDIYNTLQNNPELIFQAE